MLSPLLTIDQVYNPQVQTVVTRGEVHVQPVLNKVFKLGPCLSDEEFQNWLREAVEDQ